MKIRESDRRVVNSLQEYPGTTTWHDYEYLCPECRQWHKTGGDVTEVHDDGTESILCEPCAEKIEFPILPPVTTPEPDGEPVTTIDPKDDEHGDLDPFRW